MLTNKPTQTNSQTCLTDTAETPAPSWCEACGVMRTYRLVFSTKTRYLYQREQCVCDVEADEQRDREYRRALTKTAYRNESGIYGELAGYTLDQLKPKPRTGKGRKTATTVMEAVKIAREYIGAWPDSGSLILSGDVGCAKTHIACSIGNVLLDRLVQVRMCNMVSLLKAISDGFNRPKGEDPMSDPIVPLLTVDLLIMDELAETEYPWQREAIYRLVNGRYETGKPYIVTTNLCDAKALQNAIGARAMDRLLHRATWIEIDAPSHRLEQFAKGRKG